MIALTDADNQTHNNREKTHETRPKTHKLVVGRKITELASKTCAKIGLSLTNVRLLWLWLVFVKQLMQWLHLK